MQKDGSFKHANGAGGKLFEFTPSRVSGNALSAGTQNITFIIHLQSDLKYISSLESL